jgi:hypothetical protein
MFTINFYNLEMEYCQVFLCLAVSVTLKTEEKIMRNVHSQNRRGNLYNLKQNIFLIKRYVSIKLQTLKVTLSLCLFMKAYRRSGDKGSPFLIMTIIRKLGGGANVLHPHTSFPSQEYQHGSL